MRKSARGQILFAVLTLKRLSLMLNPAHEHAIVVARQREDASQMRRSADSVGLSKGLHQSKIRNTLRSTYMIR